MAQQCFWAPSEFGNCTASGRGRLGRRQPLQEWEVMLRGGSRRLRRDELWGFITGAVGRFAVVKVSPLKLSCINCWIICVRGFSSPAGELLDASHMSVSYSQTSLLSFPNSAALNSANFANKKLVRFFALFIISNILLGFWGFFNCQRVQKKCFIPLETSKKHAF